MAVSMMSSVSVAAPTSSFTGKLTMSSFTPTRKANRSSNAGRIKCMKVWPPKGLLKFETLSYLPPLTEVQLTKEVDYLIRNGWIPCLEFETEVSPFLVKKSVYEEDPKLMPTPIVRKITEISVLNKEVNKTNMCHLEEDEDLDEDEECDDGMS